MIHIDKWSARRLAAQCIMPRLNIEKFFDDKVYQIDCYKLVEEGIGGFCIFAGDLDKTRQAIDMLQNRSELPLMFSCDMEFGLTMRISGGTSFPHAMALGKGSPDTTSEVAAAIAKEARELGIHWNLAPVCDINSNPKNPIINIRAFGENAETVSLHSSAYITGTQSQKVLACAKHFPGHGDTETDSHLAMPILTHSANRIEELELEPFRKAIAEGVRSIMVAHLAVPAFDNAETPATLSEKIITGLLREKLGYTGIIVTDALDMKAITSRYQSGEATVKAIEAGADIALLPENSFEAIDHLENAASINPVLLDKLKQSVKKIIAEKRWCGLLPRQLPSLSSVEKLFLSHEKLALKAAVKAIEVTGSEEFLPIKEGITIAAFAILQREEDFNTASSFFNFLQQMFQNDCDFGFVDLSITEEQLEDFRKQTESAELLIFPIFSKPRAYQGTIALDDRLNDIINKLSSGRSSISILFGNPYLKNSIFSEVVISAYSDSTPSLAAAAMQFGERTMEEFE